MRKFSELKKEEILGVTAFDNMSKEEFLDTARTFVNALHDKLKDNKTGRPLEIYILGTVNGVVRNQMWFVTPESDEPTINYVEDGK